MIVPDINLLVYAYNSESPYHKKAKLWWEETVNGDTRIGVPWLVSAGFVRLMTHHRVLQDPITPSEAVGKVESWFQYDNVIPVNPGAGHLTHFRQNLEAAGVGGNLVSDAHIAAIAMEYQAEVHSNDSDFGRFSGLRWVNPLID